VRLDGSVVAFVCAGEKIPGGVTIDRADSVPVCMVNEAFVRRFLQGRSPIGVRLAIRPMSAPRANPFIRHGRRMRASLRGPHGDRARLRQRSGDGDDGEQRRTGARRAVGAIGERIVSLRASGEETSRGTDPALSGPIRLSPI
jgi:hypothetical protein